MQISIGILGYNEEYGIVHLLNSLRSQVLLQETPDLEIVVISNGSQDRMAAVARQELATFKDVQSKVVELPIADKCAAWNHLIHHVARSADYYIFLDADVVLAEPTSLKELLQNLTEHPACRICGGKVLNPRGEIVNRHHADSECYIDGKCYALRGDIARNIYIPNGVVLDDAYIASTTITNWYEMSPAAGDKLGYVRITKNPIVRFGHTPRDRDKSYWIACRKRAITAEYTQRHVDYCMRAIFGGGELAKTVSMKLFKQNPDWFIEYLKPGKP